MEEPEHIYFCDFAVSVGEEIPNFLQFQKSSFFIRNIEIICHDDDSKEVLRDIIKFQSMQDMILCITIYEMFKDKLKNLVVPEVTTEPGPREVETGNYEEFAEDEETFVDELGLE